MKLNSIQTLSIVLVVYILLFSAWWTHLLLSKNHDLYESQVAYHTLLADLDTAHAATAATAWDDLHTTHRRQRTMIVGEASVYFVILLLGMSLVYRSFRQEIALARQQRNFLLSITHELKSPIASIRLVLDTFRTRSHSLKPEQTQKLARNGIAEAERLHTLVNNILMAARLESGVTYDKVAIPPLPLVRDIIDQLQHKHPDVAFDIEAPLVLPDWYADHNAMTSVVRNLLENAVKYCPMGCGVGVKLQPVGDQVELAVADLGIGIPEEEKGKIFKKFYRVGNEDTRQTKGTGLGLYLVKSLVEAHRGTIQVRDNVPRGSVFTIRIPAAPTAPAGSPAQPPKVATAVG